MPKVVVAIDSFKNCLTSKEANQAAADGIRSVWPDAEVVQVPVSDGGEGFIEAFRAAIGGELQAVYVKDPVMRPITARYLLKRKMAVIEMAEASGLMLLSAEERNPMVATSYGTGQLVADAIRKVQSTLSWDLEAVPQAMPASECSRLLWTVFPLFLSNVGKSVAGTTL